MYTMIYTCIINTPLGNTRASAKDGALTGLWFEGQKYYPENAILWINQPYYPVFEALREWLDLYFARKNPAITIALAPEGTDFQQSVWKILQTIPYGTTITYYGVAKQLSGGKKVPSMSSLAVGGAVGHNAISVLIPCHRVIGSTGRLTGYAGGIEKKRMLLDLEQSKPD